MTRRLSLLLVFVFWAAIYLPGLGSTELKGEEARRILPAIAMLDSGDWVVPSIGGEAYLRKPPLINWLIGGSFALFDARNEWAARLPSVLCVLALGLVIAGSAARWIGTEGALAAALFSITNVSMIEKGRLAEIEAVYVVFTGIAIVLWMAWSLCEDAQGDVATSPWVRWLIPFAFLGLALLTKGPVHLLFFYVVVLATRRGRREFFSVPHLAGVLLMLAIFAAWAIPYFRETAQYNAAGVWEEQMRERVGGGSFKPGDWLVNLPRGLSNYLPWLLFLPVLWLRPVPAPWFRPVRNAVVVCYVALLLIPGVLPRYTMPLLVPLSILLAAALRDGFWIETGRRWLPAIWWRVPDAAQLVAHAPPGSPPRKLIGFKAHGLALGGAAMGAAAMVAFALVVVPQVNRTDDVRPLGRAISDAVPEGVPLYVFDPGFQPAIFYIRRPLIYMSEIRDLPEDVPYILTRAKAPAKLRKHWRTVNTLASFQDKEGRALHLLSLQDKRSGREEQAE